MCQLPDYRLESCVRPVSVTVGTRGEKRYNLLFTFMNIRSIHLEIANSLNTDSAIMEVRRFISRGRCPREILSDNCINMH